MDRCTQTPWVIENPSEELLAFVQKMRERKEEQQKRLREKKDFPITITV